MISGLIEQPHQLCGRKAGRQAGVARAAHGRDRPIEPARPDAAPGKKAQEGAHGASGSGAAVAALRCSFLLDEGGHLRHRQLGPWR
jgi:hypothetical protein